MKKSAVSTTTTTTTTTTINKPFCKVCYDTGKSEEIYTSHYVRDEPGTFGTVVCPTLLNTECRYCRKKGHTISKCPILQKNGKNRNTRLKEKYGQSNSTNTSSNTKLVKKTNNNSNHFSILALEEPEELDSPTHSTSATSPIENAHDSDTEPEIIYTGPITPPGPPPPLPRTYNWYISSCSHEE